MEIDLRDLAAMHPRLGVEISVNLAFRAGLSMQLRQHESGVRLQAQIDESPLERLVCWEFVRIELAAQFDVNRNTEDGAEGIALAFVYRELHWTVKRRLQRFESADWLLYYADDDKKHESHLVALEVSGVAGVDKGGVRLRQKISQVGRCWLEEELHVKAACVVEFGPPRLRLMTMK